MKCVLFDLYGTLVDIALNEDSPKLWKGLAAAIRKLGGVVDKTAEVRNRYRLILQDEAARGRDGFLLEPTFARLLAGFGARPDIAQIGRTFRHLSSEQSSLRPYVGPLFQALRARGCAVGIVSNTEAVLTRFDLERFPILLSADAIVLSSEVGVRKPDPAIFQIALERLHGTAHESVMVGNSLADDVEGARRAGLRAIYLDEGAHDVAVLQGDDTVLRVAPADAAIRHALATFGYPLR